MNIQAYLDKKSKKVEAALKRTLPKRRRGSGVLEEAMRYAVLSGGKRIRPILTLAACEALGGTDQDAMSAAVALELIHSYSLVHDDLPCMDNDVLRRGQPTCHAKYGEVTALLAGDALLTLAFSTLCQAASTGARAQKMMQVGQWIADAAGHRGMVGGQALDMELQSTGSHPDLPAVEYINIHKTGSLLAVCTKVGAFLGGGGPTQVEALFKYGKALGLLFQVVDDIMDGQGYVQVLGVAEAKNEAATLLEKAKSALLPLKSRGRTLHQLAEFVANRKN